MDARLITVIDRLSEDLANLARAVARAQDALDQLLHEAQKNGKTVEKRLDTIEATQRFLAGQQPRRGGTFGWPVENDDHD